MYYFFHFFQPQQMQSELLRNPPLRRDSQLWLRLQDGRPQTVGAEQPHSQCTKAAKNIKNNVMLLF